MKMGMPVLAAAAVLSVMGGLGVLRATHDAGPPETVTQVAAVPKPSPKPTIMPYARGMTGRTITASPAVPDKKAADRKLPYAADGCDRNYGAVPLCVPWAFPPDITAPDAKCAWLAKQNFPVIPVVGEDRHGLDPDGNKIACD